MRTLQCEKSVKRYKKKHILYVNVAVLVTHYMHYSIGKWQAVVSPTYLLIVDVQENKRD